MPEKNYNEGLRLIEEAEVGLKSLWALNYLGFINLEGVGMVLELAVLSI